MIPKKSGRWKKPAVMLLTAALLALTLCVGVLADLEYSVGDTVEYRLYLTGDKQKTIVSAAPSGLPAGLTASTRAGDTELWITGKAEKAGYYSVSVGMEIKNAQGEDAKESQTASVFIHVIDRSTPDPSASAKPGESPKPGTSPKPGGATPAPGTATAAPVAPPVAPPAPAGGPKITQNPMDVTVEVGGSCKLTANAAGHTWLAWRFVSADGNREIIFDVIGNTFPGLTVAGGNSTEFTLTNVPMELDGWRAVCMFGDNATRVTTTGGKITVTPKATATPEPTATPVPTPEPTPEPTATPAPTELPVTPAPTEAPTPEPTPVPEEEGGISRFMPFILMGGGALLIIGIVIAVISSVKRKKRHDEYYDDYY